MKVGKYTWSAEADQIIRDMRAAGHAWAAMRDFLPGRPSHITIGRRAGELGLKTGRLAVSAFYTDDPSPMCDLYRAGHTNQQIADALGLKFSTVASRLRGYRDAGLIEHRPKSAHNPQRPIVPISRKPAPPPQAPADRPLVLPAGHDVSWGAITDNLASGAMEWTG